MTAMPIAATATGIRVSVNPDRGAPPFEATTTQSWQPRVPWATTSSRAATPQRAHQGTLSLVVDRARSRRDATAPDPDRRGTDSSDDTFFGPVRTSTADLPDPRLWAGHIAMSLAQVCVGARPAPQVARHLSPAVYDSVLRRHARAVRRGTGTRRPMRVRRVLTSHPRDGVVEAAVILDDGGRIRPIALRLDGEDGRWILSALEML